MYAIVKAFWQIALFREGPQSLPDSRPLLMIAAGCYTAVSLLLALLSESAASGSEATPLFMHAMATTVADVSFAAIFLAGLLFYFSQTSRFQLTLTAVFGVGALQGLLLLPCLMIIMLAEVLAGLSLLALLGLLVIVLWSLAVYAHILAHALSKTFGVGMAFATLSFFLNYQLLKLIPDF